VNKRLPRARDYMSRVTKSEHLLISSYSYQATHIKLLISSCSYQATHIKLLISSCSYQAAHIKLLISSCSYQASLIPGQYQRLLLQLHRHRCFRPFATPVTRYHPLLMLTPTHHFRSKTDLQFYLYALHE